MLKVLAGIAELLVFLIVLWIIAFLSTFLHELGHAIGYMLATGDRHWHVRVGWGRRLLNTKRLTVNLLVLDGLFTHSEHNRHKVKTDSDSFGRSCCFLSAGCGTLGHETLRDIVSISLFL